MLKSIVVNATKIRVPTRAVNERIQFLEWIFAWAQQLASLRLLVKQKPNNQNRLFLFFFWHTSGCKNLVVCVITLYKNTETNEHETCKKRQAENARLMTTINATKFCSTFSPLQFYNFTFCVYLPAELGWLSWTLSSMSSSLCFRHPLKVGHTGK